MWQTKVHLHKECYRNNENWQKNLANCCHLPNSPNFFTANVFYCMVNYTNYVMAFLKWHHFLRIETHDQ